VSYPLSTRRTFLKAAGAAVPLVGTAFAVGSGQPTRVAALKGSAKSVVIPTHEFYGNLDERLDFPADWEINVMNMQGHSAPVLTQAQIARDLEKPIGKLPLREVAGRGQNTEGTAQGEQRAGCRLSIRRHAASGN